MLAHRGISAVRMAFKGQAGHASAENALSLSAVHNAMRWGTDALDYVKSQHHLRFGGLTGLRFNIGRVEGGIKANMIAPSAEVRFGFRPLPSQDMDALHAQFRGFANADALARIRGNLPRPVAAFRRRGARGGAPARGARPGRRTRSADRQRGRFLDRGLAVLRRPA